MSTLKVGQGQMRVMRVLWEKGRLSAQEVTDILNAEEPTKLSTVQTFLRTLTKKKAVAFDVDERTHIYYPLATEDKVTQHALNDFMDHVFEGSAGGMISYLVEKKYISPKELQNISKLFEENKE